MRRKYQLMRNKAQLQNRVESLLEEAHIKLCSFVSNLLGVSGRRMLKEIADGETNPETLAALADRKLRATQEQLRDALGACSELNPVYRKLLKMMLEEMQLIVALDYSPGTLTHSITCDGRSDLKQDFVCQVYKSHEAVTRVTACGLVPAPWFLRPWAIRKWKSRRSLTIARQRVRAELLPNGASRFT